MLGEAVPSVDPVQRDGEVDVGKQGSAPSSSPFTTQSVGRTMNGDSSTRHGIRPPRDHLRPCALAGQVMRHPREELIVETQAVAVEHSAPHTGSHHRHAAISATTNTRRNGNQCGRVRARGKTSRSTGARSERNASHPASSRTVADRGQCCAGDPLEHRVGTLQFLEIGGLPGIDARAPPAAGSLRIRPVLDRLAARSSSPSRRSRHAGDAASSRIARCEGASKLPGTWNASQDPGAIAPGPACDQISMGRDPLEGRVRDDHVDLVVRHPRRDVSDLGLESTIARRR